MKHFRGLAMAAALTAGHVTAFAQDGVAVDEPSQWRNAISAEEIEGEAQKQYSQILQEAAKKKALAPATHPQLIRLRTIAKRIIPQSVRFNSQAAQWKWEVNLIGSTQINAFCMPGGKIAFYTGILDKLKLNDDEVAMVMGHEIAHALREHAREQMAKQQATAVGANLLSLVFANTKYSNIANLALQNGAPLLALRFSRSDESEADLVGMDVAARAGYDPRAAVTLWEKMGQVSRSSSVDWFSTHPSSASRIEEIKRHLPEVMPLYEKAAKPMPAGKG